MVFSTPVFLSDPVEISRILSDQEELCRTISKRPSIRQTQICYIDLYGFLYIVHIFVSCFLCIMLFAYFTG